MHFGVPPGTVRSESMLVIESGQPMNVSVCLWSRADGCVWAGVGRSDQQPRGLEGARAVAPDLT